MVKYGAKFYKSDLHIHTNASKCYKNKDISVEDIISKAIEQKLDIIAITDHNDISNIEKAKKFAKGKPIFIFPGIEITAIGGHILAIFDLDYPIERLNDFLPKVEITSESRGKDNALACDFEDVLEIINEFNGLGIAAHADDENGFLTSISQGRHRIKIYSNEFLKGLELINPENIKNYSKGLKANYNRKIACIQSSDSHNVTEICRRFCYFKMDGVSLEGIRQALLDHEIKIRHMTDQILFNFPHLKSIKATKGFFEDEVFDFHPNLNCVIGGKGTGKSLLIEFLRFGFEDISNIEDIRNDHYTKIKERLGENGKIIVVCEDENGCEFYIKREYNSLLDFTLNSEVTVKLTGEKTIFPFKPLFFSQGEIARISSLPLAQLELIDNYIDIGEENNKEEAIIDALNKNAHEWQNNYEKKIQLEQILQDRETGTTATEEKLSRLKADITEPILTDFPKWHEEQNYLNKLLEGLNILEESARSFYEEIDVNSYFPNLLTESFPNYDKLKNVEDFKNEIINLLDDAFKRFSKFISQKRKQVQEVIDELKPKYENKKEQHNTYLSELGVEDVRNMQNQILYLQKLKSEMQSQEMELIRINKKYEDLINNRQDLIKKLKKVRTNRYKKRCTKAKELEACLNNQININIISNGDREEYFQKLCYLATGSFIRDKDLKIIVKNLDPDIFINKVLNEEIEFICSKTEIEEESIEKLILHLQTKRMEDLLNIQSVKLIDLPEIRFRIDKHNWRLLEKCSIGQKSTAILSLALVEGNQPLIIDQPEDALDTIFIYQMIVKKLRQEKEGRQYILTTHNPNILVSADSDLSFILEASAVKGKITSKGGLDKIDTNELVLLNLEGGPEAFCLRSQKYIKIKH